MNKFSVIVIVYNKSELLKKCLISLNNQSLLPNEVIITDDGSEENILESLNEILPSLNFKVKYIKQKHKGFRAAKARNNAIRITSNEKIIFFDQDIISTRKYVETFINNLTTTNFIVSYPIRLTQLQSDLINEDVIRNFNYLNILTVRQKLKIKQQFIEDKYAYWMKKIKLIGKGPKLRAGVFAIYRKNLIEVNGFDENYTEGGGEDDDLGNRLYANNVIGQNPFWKDYPLHLFHSSNYNKEKKLNDEYLKKRKLEVKQGKIKCKHGLENTIEDDIILNIDLN